MLMWRKMLALVTIVGAVALLGPAAALATGPSAGDQQYVDPLGGSHSSGGSHHSSGGSHSSGSSTTPSSTATTPGTSPTTPSAGATVSSSTTTTTASASPTATTASTSATSAKDPKSLPRTGFDVWLAVLIGAGLLSSGLIVRRTVRGER
jgi:LPXTG-motif cell wall-anchored protein